MKFHVLIKLQLDSYKTISHLLCPCKSEMIGGSVIRAFYLDLRLLLSLRTMRFLYASSVKGCCVWPKCYCTLRL